MQYMDTYFFNGIEAYNEAKKNHKNNNYHLQVCYYDGDKIDSDLVNLVHLPLENIIELLATGTYRLPTSLSFAGLDISDKIKEDIVQNFILNLNEAVRLRKGLNNYYVTKLKETSLDFAEPLRFYLIANTNTQVMQYVSSNIASTLKSIGFEVLLGIYYGCEDNNCLKKLCDFNPHVTININNLNNNILAEDVFNFVWFQDPMPFLLDKTKVSIRERDFVFSLLPLFDAMLQTKSIPFQRQGFCVNDSIYKPNPTIKREKKIVFIGSSYLHTIPNTPQVKAAFQELHKVFLSGESFTDAMMEHISVEYQLDIDFIRSRFIPYIVRDMGILELCKIKSEYKIEIYGWRWEVYEELQPYYKGVLKYGQEIADVYSSATFAFAPHQQYTLQQRTFEASACGAIPIVYDCRDISEEENYEDALYYYKTSHDLEKILHSDIEEKDFTTLLSSHTYKDFVEKIIKTVKENR